MFIWYTIIFVKGEKIRMKTITVCNSKGGVAKSTSSQAIATILNQLGHKTLTIDCDSQRNTSDAYNAIKDFGSGQKNMFDVFSGRCELKDAITETEIGDIIVSDKHLDSASIWIKDSPEEANFLKKRLKELEAISDYEYVVIDTSPSQNLVVDCSLLAADEIIIPADDDIATLYGVIQLISHIGNLETSYNTKINIGGVLLVKYTNRTKSWKNQETSLNVTAERLGTKVYKAKIPNATAVKDAHREQSNIAHEFPKSKVTIAYRELVNELLEEK